jgi:hypothetical protein
MYNILSSIGKASVFVMPCFWGGCRLFGCLSFALVCLLYAKKGSCKIGDQQNMGPQAQSSHKG